MIAHLHRRAGLLALALCLAVTLLAPRVGAQEVEPARYQPSTRGPRAIIAEAAARHDVAAGPLIDLALCESSLRPDAVGDHGRSHGLMQLSDLPTGLIWHFYAVGYSDAYDADQAADYVARVAAGTWASEGVTLGRWSCYWTVIR